MRTLAFTASRHEGSCHASEQRRRGRSSPRHRLRRHSHRPMNGEHRRSQMQLSCFHSIGELCQTAFAAFSPRAMRTPRRPSVLEMVDSLRQCASRTCRWSRGATPACTQLLIHFSPHLHEPAVLPVALWVHSNDHVPNIGLADLPVISCGSSRVHESTEVVVSIVPSNYTRSSFIVHWSLIRGSGILFGHTDEERAFRLGMNVVRFGLA